jgi:methylase of polypeptide subunit release factors
MTLTSTWSYKRLVRKWLWDHYSQHAGMKIRPRWIRRIVSRGLSRHFIGHEPLAYILGDQPFLLPGLRFKTRAPVLIPRPETEEWTARLANAIKLWTLDHPNTEKLLVLDLCCGTGCISFGLAASLLSNRNGTVKYMHILAVDVSKKALNLAKLNQKRVLAPFLQNSGAVSQCHVQYLHLDVLSSPDTLLKSISDWIYSSKAQTDKAADMPIIMVCNPPYIPKSSMNTLPKSVYNWEDHRALDGINQKGTEFYHAIHRHILPMVPFSLVAMEIHGINSILDPLGSIATSLSSTFPFSYNSSFHRDISGRPRLWLLWPKFSNINLYSKF